MDINQSKLFKDVVLHNFFSKNSGHSKGLYTSLNCSTYVGDNIEDVKKNLDDIKNFIGAVHLCSLKQVHGTKVLIIDDNFDFSNSQQILEADAIVTQKRKIGLGILTADCAPVLLHDEQNDTIGVIHCGWKSARFGAIENTILAMKRLVKNKTRIVAAIGPCIHPESYIVQKNFIENFSFRDAKFFIKENDVYRFNLPAYVGNKLLENGVSQVDILNIDTYKSNNFFSYRKANLLSNGVCGRQLSVIMLK